MKLEGHVSPEGHLLGLLELQLQEMVGHLLDLGDGRKEVVHRLGKVQDLWPKGLKELKFLDAYLQTTHRGLKISGKEMQC